MASRMRAATKYINMSIPGQLELYNTPTRSTKWSLTFPRVPEILSSIPFENVNVAFLNCDFKNQMS
jgi:hypothetical protein